jgi:hypothetical protein
MSKPARCHGIAAIFRSAADYVRSPSQHVYSFFRSIRCETLTWTAIKGWITTEIFLVNRTPEEIERFLGFDSPPGHEYLANGIDVFEFTRPISARSATP